MTNKNIKLVAFQYTYEAIMKLKNFEFNTAKDVQIFVSSKIGQQCCVGEIPWKRKFVINIVLEDKSGEELLEILKPFGIEQLKEED